MAWQIILKPQMERQLKKLRRKQTQLEQEVLKVHLPKIAQAPRSIGKHLKGRLQIAMCVALRLWTSPRISHHLRNQRKRSAYLRHRHSREYLRLKVKPQYSLAIG